MCTKVLILFISLILLCVYEVFSRENFKTSKIHEYVEPESKLPGTQESFVSITKASERVIDRIKPLNYCKTLSKFSRSKYLWEDVSVTWQRRFRKFGYWICFRDCGGGGDCLYKSIISSLRLGDVDVSLLRLKIADEFVGFNATSIQAYDTELKTQELQVVISSNGTTSIDSNSTKCSGTCSKPLQASNNLTFSWDEEAFLEKMNILMTMEISGEWQDSWSPSRVSNSDTLDGTDISTNLKKALLVHKYLSEPGNIHWGNQWDVNYIEKIYNVKVIIFWKNRGIFYPTLGTETQFSRIVLIYYDDLIGHFQVIGIKKMTSPLNTDLVSVFQKDKIPTSLNKLFKEDTNNDLIN
ncbi:putative transmembrane protein [Cryptosporidium felis]|nr:putative transmembrane protein [Cryptosporidium felis]